jgi:long-chain fatty acid transport protein
MRRLVQTFVCITALAILGSQTAPSAWALGFRNPDQDARATGQGEAFVAQADDASAIYYNPAGLTQHKGTQVTSGGMLVFRDIQFHGAGASDDMTEPAFTPNIFLATDFGLEKWRFGVGAFVPYGNSMNWGNGPMSALVRYSNLTVYNIAPTVAYQFNEHFSFGAALNVYHGTTDLKFDYFPLLPGSHSRFSADGDAVGATVGLMWKITDQHTLGVVYRSPFAIDFSGRAKNVNAGPFTTSAGASAQIDFPQQVAAGYAFRPIKNWKLEVDVEWTNWETLNTVRLHSSDPIVTGDPRTTIPFNWMDSFFYEFGTQYDIGEHWAARAGYIFSENTVPTSTFSPNLPDSDRHVFSVGFGYDSKDNLVLFSKLGLSVDVVYQYALSADRTIPSGKSVASPLVDGKWESSSHAVMMTTTLKF